MSTSSQDYARAIAALRWQIEATEEQRDKHPGNSPLWNQFDDMIWDLKKQVIANSVAADRTLANRIIVEFNLEQKAK